MFKPTRSKNDAPLPTAFKQADIRRAYRETRNGNLELTVKVAPKVERLTHIQIAGFTLLRDALEEMTPKEVQFAGQMYAHKYDNISEKQAKWLDSILDRYLGLSLTTVTA